MKKYHFAICVLLLISLNTYLHSQSSPWENISNQIPGDSLNNLSDVIVVDRFTSYISSISEHEIYRNYYWAGTWETVQTPSPVAALYFLYYSFGFICGTDSNLYQTIDEGESWENVGSFGEQINDIDFGYDIYNPKGYVCGNNGTIGVIEDTSLVVIQSGHSINFVKISFPYNDDKVWLVGDSSVYLYDGFTFSKQFTSGVKLNSVYFWNEFYGLIVGGSGYIAKTTDGGNTWVQKQNPDPINRNLNDINFVSFLGFAVGDNGLILETTDAGESWTMNSGQLTTNNLQAVHIAGGFGEWGPGLAVGKNKTALLYPVVVSVDDKAGPADNFYLYQNYPNPFNPTTTLSFVIGNQSFVLLKVYDVLGNEIATLVNEEKQSGTYEIEFDATSLPSGIYFYQLQAGSVIQTRKMVYLK
jgi:photosystem II stability/assembly factor-like uncharacterized protein